MATDKTWKQEEQDVYQQTAAKHPAAIYLADVCNLFLRDGILKLQGLKTKSAVQELNYLLTLDAYNNLYVGSQLAFKGYYGQSLSLTRNAFERWLTAAYLTCSPESAPHLKQEDARWPKQSRMRTVVAEQWGLSEEDPLEFLNDLNNSYDFTSRFSHPSRLSLVSVYSEDSTPRVGPYFNENHLLNSAWYNFKTSLFFSELLLRTYPEGMPKDWEPRSRQLASRIVRWKDEAVQALNTSGTKIEPKPSAAEEERDV